LREKERSRQESENTLDNEDDGKNLELKKGMKVLGKETLKAIQEDMERLSLPTWVTPPPK